MRERPRPGVEHARLRGGLKVDHGLDRATVKGKDGMVHEFQVSKDTLRDLKPGHKVEAALRSAPKCP